MPTKHNAEKEEVIVEIIFVTASMTGGGTERVISLLANRFVQEHHQVSIFMTAGDEVAYTLREEIGLFSAGGQSGGSLRKRLERIKKMRDYFRNRPHAVICGMGVETNLFTVLAAWGLKNRVVISERNDPNQCGYKRLRNFFYNRADVLVCQTEEARRCFPGRAGKRAVVIPNPLAPELVGPFHGERRREIVTAGRLTFQKNHALLLESFALFHRKYADYSLVIYGKGELEDELRKKAAELGIADYVSFPGFTANLPEKIRDASIYVLSSDYEGISNSLAEAMAVGLPVISTDCPIGGSKMCIRDGQNGLLVPVGDAQRLASAMERLAGDPAYAAGLGREAEQIRERYSLESIGHLWMKCLKG